VELIRLKKTVKRGDWEKWVEDHCEYNIRTAQKYMGVAEGVKNKALREATKTNLRSFLELLERPASSLTEAEQHQLLQSVHNLTDGETIQQLYLDFGVIKKGKGGLRGGDTSGKGEKLTPEEEQAQREATLRADSLSTASSLEALGPKYRILTDAEIETFAEQLEAKAAEMRAWLKTPKSKRPVLDTVKALLGEPAADL
jgi:hypothetical protein